MYVSVHLFYCKIIILFKLDSHYFTLFLEEGLFISFQIYLPFIFIGREVFKTLS